MTRSTSQPFESTSLKKLQLPNPFKTVGFAVLIIAFLGLLVNKATLDAEYMRSILKYGMLVGLLIVSISKEKIEDEYIVNLRMQSYTFAFIACVLFSLTMPFLDYFVDVLREKEAIIKANGDFQILWLLLSFQIAYFELSKRAN